MNLLLFPFESAILNTFLRSIVLIIGLVFGYGTTLYNAYWAAIVHDIISLILIRPYV
jgi:hypothetical protein